MRRSRSRWSRGQLGRLLSLRRAPYRALPDPHARNVLRQPRARRSRLRMVPGRGDARRRDACPQRARHADDPRRQLLPWHHEHGSSRTTSCWPRYVSRSCRMTPGSASTSSAAAPGTSPSRMALVTFRIANGMIVEPRVGVGGAEARPRRIHRAEAALNARRPDAEAFGRGSGCGRHGDRSARGHPIERRVPARPRARGDAARTGAGARMSGATPGSGTTWVGRAIRRLEDPRW